MSRVFKIFWILFIPYIILAVIDMYAPWDAEVDGYSSRSGIFLVTEKIFAVYIRIFLEYITVPTAPFSVQFFSFFVKSRILGDFTSVFQVVGILLIDSLILFIDSLIISGLIGLFKKSRSN